MPRPKGGKLNSGSNSVLKPPDLPPETCRSAVEVVVRHAADSREARYLLEMLGLTDR
jgi:hypothetical protein